MLKAKIYISGFLLVMISFLSFWIYSEYQMEWSTQKRKIRYKQEHNVRQLIYDELNIKDSSGELPDFSSMGSTTMVMNYSIDTAGLTKQELAKWPNTQVTKVLDGLGKGLKNALGNSPYEVRVSSSNVLQAIIPQILFAVLLLSISFFLSIALYNIFRKQREISLERNYFISSLTHELKTPISIISVALEAILHYQKDPEKRIEYIKSSREQINKLNKSIDQILTYNDDSNLNIQFERVELTAIIDELIRDVTEIVQNKEGQIKFYSSVKGAPYDVDKHHFMHMLYNIIDNSIKYSEESPQIKISLSKEEKRYTIRIEDSGIGIGKKDQEQIFNQFYRANSNYEKKGHGIGLYYVKKIVDLHNGEIDMESILGVGTIFNLKLPIYE